MAWCVYCELTYSWCRLFPGLTKAIYLDSDIIVQHDINDFWSKLQLSDKIVTTVKRYVVQLLAHCVPISISCLLFVQEYSILWRCVCSRGKGTVQTEVGT